MLSDCAVKSICDYLSIPNGTISIHDNASGCNSKQEIETACDAVGIERNSLNNVCTLYPNPSSGIFLFNFTVKVPVQVKLVVLNCLGQEVGTLLNDRLVSGSKQVIWDAKGLPAGMYHCHLQYGSQVSTGKMILMK